MVCWCDVASFKIAIFLKTGVPVKGLSETSGFQEVIADMFQSDRRCCSTANCTAGSIFSIWRKSADKHYESRGDRSVLLLSLLEARRLPRSSPQTDWDARRRPRSSHKISGSAHYMRRFQVVWSVEGM